MKKEMKTKKTKKKVSPLISMEPPKEKKAKQVTGNKARLGALDQLKKVNQEIEKTQATNEKQFRKQDKLFSKRRTLEQKLGIG